MNIRWRVELSQDEREELTALLKSGRHAVRKVKRAQILLAADDGVGDGEVAARVGAGGSTVYRTKRRFVEGNLELALVEAPRPGAQRKLSGKEEALLIATACSAPPAGRARWTLELLADVMVALTEHEGLSRETVRRRLAENALKPWRRDMWCVPKVDAAYVAAMEDVLDLYGEPPDPTRPVICFDESPTQLIGEVRAPIPAEPGRLERFDFEYKRNGTVNIFIFLDVNRPWRKVKVTERRAAADFSQCMRELSDVHFPEAKRSGSSWTTSRPTARPPSTTPCPHPRPGASSAAWSSTSPPSTPAGSTWWRSRSASCAANASTAGSPVATSSKPRSPPGSDSATTAPRASNGCSRRRKPDTN